MDLFATLWRLSPPRPRARRYKRPSPGARERSEKRASDLTSRTRAKRASDLTATEASGRRAVCSRSKHQEKARVAFTGRRPGWGVKDIPWAFHRPSRRLVVSVRVVSPPGPREERYERPSPGARGRSEKRATDLTASTRAERATDLTATEASGRRTVFSRSEGHYKGRGSLSPAAGRVGGWLRGMYPPPKKAAFIKDTKKSALQLQRRT